MIDSPHTEPPQGRRRLLILLASALAAFVACTAVALVVLILTMPVIRNQIPFLAAQPAISSPPEAPDKFRPLPPGPVTIREEFAAPSEQWDRSQTQLVAGTYELRLESANFDSYGLFLGSDQVRDFDLAVDATHHGGPLNGEYGIRFRQRNPDDHLLFSVSASGYYRLLRVRDRTFRSEVPWTRHEAIRLGNGATNRLRLVADGPQITGFINGVEVLRYTDPSPAAGQLTLGLVTFDQGGLTVRFDNLAGFAISAAPANPGMRLTLDENFNDPQQVSWSLGGATIRNGAYEFFVGGPVVSWQQPLPTGASEVRGDFVLEVDAAMISGAGGGSGYGVMFGDGGEFDFLALLLLPEGGLMLYSYGPESGFIIPPVEFEAVNPGLDALNRIRVVTSGQTLTITLNGEELPPIELPPDIRLSGRVGMIVQGAESDGIRVRFERFVLEEQQRSVRR
ncbi:MAG: hypothetical protein AB4911_13950 [Oscillochloridaceae bacterium umkhey_bin13]